MNEIEIKAFNASATLWAFLVEMDSKEKLNDDIINNFRFHIQAIQALIMARPEIRKEHETR